MAKKLNKPNKLDVLAKRIKAEHRAVIGSNRKGLEHAYRAGKLLLDAKQLAKVEGLVWKAWVEKNCGVGERQERKYRYIADNWKIVLRERKRNSGLSIDEAVAFIRKEKGITRLEPDDDLTHAEAGNMPGDVNQAEVAGLLTYKPDNDNVKPADVQTYNLDMTEADLNDDEVELLTAKMQQHNIQGKLTDVLGFLTDVFGGDADEVLRMLAG
jgi:hypothetical protein